MLINNEKEFLFSSPIVVDQMKHYLQEQQGLSRRESEVVILVVQGLTNKQVADQLCVAEKTVKFHLTNVYKRMKISRRSQIIWTLPMTRFIDNVKDNTEPVVPTPAHHQSHNLNITRDSAEIIDDHSIPIGNSTVTDNL